MAIHQDSSITCDNDSFSSPSPPSPLLPLPFPFSFPLLSSPPYLSLPKSHIQLLAFKPRDDNISGRIHALCILFVCFLNNVTIK